MRGRLTHVLAWRYATAAPAIYSRNYSTRVIELQSDELIFSFPELCDQLQERIRVWVDERLESSTSDEKNMLPSAREEIHRTFAACLPRVSAAVSFQRTLRMPDNGRAYPLPLGLGRFSLYPVEDFAGVPEIWKPRGGVMLALHPTEALWLSFYADYPMALRIGAGGSCAVCGEPWASALQPSPQNYVVLGCQPWLDGFHAGPEIVRQFVATPLGQGVLGAHALSGEDKWGGLQLQAFPLRADEFWRQSLKATLNSRWDELMTPIRHRSERAPMKTGAEPEWTSKTDGKIRLKIMDDPYGIVAWDTSHSSRCFAHLCLTDDWQRLTGIRPPQKPPTAEDFAQAGIMPAPESIARPETNSTNARILEALRQEESGGSPAMPRSIIRLNPDLRQTVREF